MLQVNPSTKGSIENDSATGQFTGSREKPKDKDFIAFFEFLGYFFKFFTFHLSCHLLISGTCKKDDDKKDDNRDSEGDKTSNYYGNTNSNKKIKEN